MFKSTVFLPLLASMFTTVISYPADHREETLLPFGLGPGNPKLESYYLDKYPQVGSQSDFGLPFHHKMFTIGANVDPIVKQQLSLQHDHDENDENMVLLDAGEGFRVMSRARREANPQFHHHHHHGGHHHHYPRFGYYYNPYNSFYNRYLNHHHHHHHH
ncbi:unnamed protein product [Orchesella dallaii]|uniref:Uncharacterized protein n=1 Tax=Orchesella dallaii TaxID=48710 RepID=A0ABP1S7B6_9HEXA